MIHSNFKAFTLSLFSIFSGFFNVAYANTITKKAYVEIVTGTYAGQTGEAIFSYDTDRISGNGQESIKGNGILFNFLGQIVTGQPTILLEDGEFKDLAWTGTLNGPYGRTFNFGFNSGFTKRKFSRPDESFVQKGPYFGYLNSSSLVDGAGTVQYKGDECKMQNTDPRVISNNVLEFRTNNMSMRLVPQDFNNIVLQLTVGHKPTLMVSLNSGYNKKLSCFIATNFGKTIHVSINGVEFSAAPLQSSIGSEMLITGVLFKPAIQPAANSEILLKHVPFYPALKFIEEYRMMLN